MIEAASYLYRQGWPGLDVYVSRLASSVDKADLDIYVVKMASSVDKADLDACVVQADLFRR